MQYSNVEDDKSYTATWQDSMPDIAWGTLFLFLGIVLGYYLVIHSALDGSISYPVATLICAYLAFASFTVAHDAGHGSVIRLGSPFKPVETIVGWIASIPLLLVPYRFFQKIHDRHHAFTNDPDRDPDQYTFGDKWYQIALNCLWIPFRYHVLSVTTIRHIKVIRDTYPSTIAYFVVILGLGTVLVQSGYGTELICFALVPNVIAVFVLTMFFDYVPHHPHKSRDRYHDTRIYPGKLLNVLLLGQNYHLIHHMYPRLPWYTYQEVYHQILPDLEAHGAPIEDIGGGIRPGFLKSPNARNVQEDGKSVNMLLKVAEIERLTPDSVSVKFELPDDSTQPERANKRGQRSSTGEAKTRLQYQAGQYITVSKWLAGEQQTRCYSLCVSPNKGELKIGVRQTPNGLMSGFINRELEAGNELVVQGPFGDFVFPPCDTENHGEGQDNKIESLILIAGGSGITPILSIMETALEEAYKPAVHLIYACRSRDSIMFFDQIESLNAANPNALNVTYVIEQNTLEPLGVHGRLDGALLMSLLPDLKFGDKASATGKAEFYICGPEGLKNTVVDTLADNNVNMKCVHIEQSVADVTEPVGDRHRVDIILADGQRQALRVASNQTVLEVAKSEGVKLPHACGNGTCGSCKCKVNSGLIDDIPLSIPGITLDEKSAGYTLACQCRPLGDVSLSEITT